MRQAIELMVLAALALALAAGLLGPEAALRLGRGVLAMLSVLIAASFLWLWQQRATPLALGMAYAWSGLALLIGAGWAGMPEAVPAAATWIAAMALLLTGAVLHLAAIQASFGLRGGAFLVPLAGALALALALGHAP